MISFTFDAATVVQLLVAFVLPVLVGLVTQRMTHAGVKAATLAGLSLVTSLLVELGRALTAGQTYDVGVALLATLPAFIVSVSSHFGLWKPIGVADAAQAVGAPRGTVPEPTRAEIEGPDDVEESDDPVPAESSVSYIADPNPDMTYYGPGDGDLDPVDRDTR